MAVYIFSEDKESPPYSYARSATGKDKVLPVSAVPGDGY